MRLYGNDGMLALVIALLQREGRVSYWALKQELDTPYRHEEFARWDAELRVRLFVRTYGSDFDPGTVQRIALWLSTPHRGMQEGNAI